MTDHAETIVIKLQAKKQNGKKDKPQGKMNIRGDQVNESPKPKAHSSPVQNTFLA